MLTKQEAIEKVKAEAATKLAEVEAKYAVLDKLGPIIEGYEEPHVHYYKLYGTVGSIAFRPCYYDSIKNGKNPDRTLFANLLAQYPPLPKVMVCDGCKSFRPNAEWKGELLDVYPITAHIEVYQGQKATFEWFTNINDAMWELQIEFMLYRTTLGTARVEVERDRYENVIRYTRTEFLRETDCQLITWASGGPQYPKSFELYWDPDTGKAMHFPELIKEQ